MEEDEKLPSDHVQVFCRFRPDDAKKIVKVTNAKTVEVLRERHVWCYDTVFDWHVPQKEIYDFVYPPHTLSIVTSSTSAVDFL